MKSIKTVAAVIGIAALAGCADDLVVPNFNNPSIESLRENPTAAAISAASTGLLIGAREDIDDPNGYVSLLGIVGRESYNFDGADPRFVTEMLESQLNPSSPAFGGNLWEERYRNIRTGTVILEALGKVSTLTETQKEAIRGFVRTMQAHALLLVINTRHDNGVALDFQREPTAEPAPLSTRAEGLARVATLLDEARTNLEQGGGEFPFPLSSGFAGFDSPATFLQFNRALRARVAVYRGNFGDALTFLAGSFIMLDPAALDLGVYHSYGTGSGDATNGLFDPGQSPVLYAHPSIIADAEARANGEPDLRVQRKIRQVSSETVRDITSSIAFSIYTSPSAPVPIIRNEELILLRAEANIGLDNPGAALADLNFIRVNSGGLPPLAGPAQATLDELLEQKRFSLLYEGGHRWIDLRRYGRLDELPLAQPNHRRNVQFPIPEQECLARDLGIPCGLAAGS